MNEIDAAKRRFRTLTPRLHQDKRFEVNIIYSDDGIPFPSVSLRSPDPDWGYPTIDVFRRAEDQYQLVLQRMLLITNGNTPSSCVQPISETELDGMILNVFDTWINMLEAMRMIREHATFMYGERVLPL